MPEFSLFSSDSAALSPQRAANNNPNFGSEFTSPAVVILGPVAINSTSKMIAQDIGTLATDCLFRTKVCKDLRIYNIGITSPTGFQSNSTAFIQMSAPLLRWVVRWTTSRLGAIPGIPEPTPNSGSDWVLMGDHYEPGTIWVPTDGGTPYYRISGTYIYGSRNPNPRTILALHFSVPQWLDPASFTTTVVEANMKRNMFGLE